MTHKASARALGSEFAVEVNFESEELLTQMVMSVEMGIDDVTTKLKVIVDTSKRSVTIPHVIALKGTAACMAACGIAAGVGPLMECYDRDLQKYTKCLHGKGRAVAADILKCLIGCAAGTL